MIVTAPWQGITGSDRSPKPNSARANEDLPLPDRPNTRYKRPAQSLQERSSFKRRDPNPTSSCARRKHGPPFSEVGLEGIEKISSQISELSRARYAKTVNHPLKIAIVAFFNLAKCEAKLRTALKITTYVVILRSHPCDRAAS